MQSGDLMAFEGAGKGLFLLSRPLPELGEGELLIRNLYTTICGSDLHTYCGLRTEKVPTVLGHEVVGRVERIQEAHNGLDYSGNRLQPGDLVTWTVFCADPHSAYSCKGMPQKTPDIFKYGHAQIKEGEAFHGGLATHCVLREHTVLLKLPEALPLPVAATINCAIATVAGALRLAGDIHDKRVLITGMGLLGMVCAAMCREAGATNIYAADIDEDRLQQAVGFGADSVFLLPEGAQGVVTECPEADIVFDMSGIATAMEAGLKSLTTGGIAVWIGAVFKHRQVQVDAEQIIRKMITIKGLHNYNYQDFAYAVDFIVQHHATYPFGRVVTKEFKLKDAEAAFAYAIANKPLRVGINLGA